jgi:hypothetical protein
MDQEDIIMLAEPSKDNTRILDETLTVLLNSIVGNTKKITHIVVQLTDNYRYQVFKREHSGHIQPDNLASQVKNKRCFVKMNNWFWDKKYKIGTHVILPSMSKNRAGEWIEDFRLYNLGDTTEGLVTLRTLIKLNCLQTYCQLHDIKLCIVNYYGFYKWVEDPLYKSLDPKNFLIENSAHGLFNHMLWLRFQQLDNFHFDEEAHKWQANLITEFLQKGHQLTVEEEIFDKKKVLTPIYDYGDQD